MIDQDEDNQQGTDGQNTDGSNVEENVNASEASDQSKPEFQELNSNPVGSNAPANLNRFSSVQVELAVELGRAQVSIQELTNIEEGSVLELDRDVDAPVELVAQGIPMGNGEVVVVNDRFAIRIKQIYQNTKN